MTDPFDEHITPVAMVDTSLVNNERTRTTTELNQNDDGVVKVFDEVIATDHSSRPGIFYFNGQREVVIDAFDPDYTIGKIPEFCQVCFCLGARDTAVKICANCKKQSYKYCEEKHKHLGSCEPRDRDTGAIVEDTDDGQ